MAGGAATGHGVVLVCLPCCACEFCPWRSHLAATQPEAAPPHLQSVCCTTPHSTPLAHATRRHLENNKLATLPDGIFELLGSLRQLCVCAEGGARGGRWRCGRALWDAGMRAMRCM